MSDIHFTGDAYFDRKVTFDPRVFSTKLLVLNHEYAISDKPLYIDKVVLSTTYDWVKMLGNREAEILVSLANNHALDAGVEGLKATIDYLDSNGISWIGAGSRSCNYGNPKLIDIEEQALAFLSYDALLTSEVEELPQGIARYSRETIGHDIRLLDDIDADLKIVLMHWGDEENPLPTDRQREEASFIGSLGVDLIVGHHPHTIQPSEQLFFDGHTTDVYYSLGNLFFPDFSVRGFYSDVTPEGVTYSKIQRSWNRKSLLLAIDLSDPTNQASYLLEQHGDTVKLGAFMRISTYAFPDSQPSYVRLLLSD